jgi:hypothetical protein
VKFPNSSSPPSTCPFWLRSPHRFRQRSLSASHGPMPRAPTEKGRTAVSCPAFACFLAPSAERRFFQREALLVVGAEAAPAPAR